LRLRAAGWAGMFLLCDRFLHRAAKNSKSSNS
jgi:hypothetical protein